MLGLRQHVRRDEPRIGRSAGQDDHFAGTGNHVDVHLSEDFALRRGDIGVAGADDLVDAGDRFGAVSKGRNSLGASHQVDLRHVQLMQGGGNDGMLLERAGRS